MSGSATTRIVLVDDHRLFADGLNALLSLQPDLEVVGVAGDAGEALALLERLPHDLVIVDISLPGTNGLALLRELRARGHRPPVLVLTMHGEPDLVSEALKAGAAGYALKRERSVELLQAVRTTAQRRIYLSPLLRGSVGQPRASAAPGPLATLSEREREIFAQMLRGQTNRDIAVALAISIKTVETHRCHIFRKLAVHSISDLLRLAARHGMLPAM